MAPILRTLCVWLPIATLPLLLLSVSHIHAVHLALVTASAFGGMRSWRTVVIGPAIHLSRLLQLVGWADLWMPTARTACRKSFWIRLGSRSCFSCWPVAGSCQRCDCGNTHCLLHATGALGELLPRASGCCTRPWPSARSLGWICRTGAGGGRVETAAAGAHRVSGAGGR